MKIFWSKYFFQYCTQFPLGTEISDRREMNRNNSYETSAFVVSYFYTGPQTIRSLAHYYVLGETVFVANSIHHAFGAELSP